MKKSIFDDMKLSVFDDIDLSIFDEMEPEIEDKVIYSSEMRQAIKDEIIKRIAEIPIGKIVSSVVQKKINEKIDEDNALKEYVKSRMSKISVDVDNRTSHTEDRINRLKNEVEKTLEKLKEKYDELRNIINQPKYEFGGFPINFDNVNIGKYLYFGDPNTEGTWRFRDDGTNLQVERLESGVWNSKSAFNQ